MTGQYVLINKNYHDRITILLVKYNERLVRKIGCTLVSNVTTYEKLDRSS